MLRDWEWRYLKRRHFEDVKVHADHDGDVLSAAFSPDGRYLVAVDDGRSIHVRDRGRAASSSCRASRAGT